MVRLNTAIDFWSPATITANESLRLVENRMYDPTVGVFISPDPIEADANNSNRYVGNSPKNGTDPSGLAAEFSGTAEENKQTIEGMTKIIKGFNWSLGEDGTKTDAQVLYSVLRDGG